MSAMKRHLDSLMAPHLAELGARAAAAARLDTFEERLAALTAVFEECGHRANAFPCPAAVAEQFVQLAVIDFQLARMEWETEVHSG
ncbi:hypothetical protein GPA10_22425 [Streptomyces sp. p1417]|uniref:Uncharacterized protein n=1 Tax=Streptomyces typhae TaxID=2681492 RepID=A0A6L6X0X4_9ACTN|nr:hypothetical protein [Streptomyces typhae]MVO87442.1 hypothetical protein [Streptomyces typhae]